MKPWAGWPSGLRRQTQVLQHFLLFQKSRSILVSKEARVRIALQSHLFCSPDMVTLILVPLSYFAAQIHLLDMDLQLHFASCALGCSQWSQQQSQSKQQLTVRSLESAWHDSCTTTTGRDSATRVSIAPRASVRVRWCSWLSRMPHRRSHKVAGSSPARITFAYYD